MDLMLPPATKKPPSAEWTIKDRASDASNALTAALRPSMSGGPSWLAGGLASRTRNAGPSAVQVATGSVVTSVMACRTFGSWQAHHEHDGLLGSILDQFRGGRSNFGAWAATA